MPARVVAAGTVFCLFATVCQVFTALLHQHFLMSLGAQETVSAIFCLCLVLSYNCTVCSSASKSYLGTM